MKVAAYEGIRNIRVQERAYPVISPTEAIVKVKYCGICGTDLHSFLVGRQNANGLVFGHEVVGTVVELGEKVKGSNIGDRVVVGPSGSCGECFYCLRGQTNLCLHGHERTIGLSPGVDGGMAEYVKVAYPENMLIKIPNAVSFEDAVLMDTITVAFHALRVSSFCAGDNVVVTGAGPIGLSVIEFAKISGARHITALQPSPVRRKMALEFGADASLNPREEKDLTNKIAAMYGGIGAEICFECVGTPEAFLTSLTLVRKSGQVVTLGSSRQPAGVLESQITGREIDIKGSRVYTREEIKMCLDFIAQGRFVTKNILSDIISLDDIVERGFKRLETDKTLLKVAIAP
jgi:2-desacetyl-2-hydroxyethyl bacteriochlorophyllide A dehydrogenase